MNIEQARYFVSEYLKGTDEESAQAIVDLMASVVATYEIEHRCPECGSPMHRPVSVWRCTSGDSSHELVGAEIATELRIRMEKVE